MTVHARVAGLVSAMLVLAGAPAVAAVLTGSVRSQGAQAILVPPSLTSPVTLHFYVPDGTRVDKGDAVLRIDASAASGQLDTLEDKIALARATHAKELAELQLKVIDAELALEQAEAERAKAEVDAGIPRDIITALDYDRYQGTWKSSKRDAALKRDELRAARAAVGRQRRDGELDLRKQTLEKTFYEGQVQSATVRARQAGVVVHGFQSMTFFGAAPGRFREGSTTFPGTQVGEVVGGASHYSVRAFALQPDRAGLEEGQAVRVSFDALPGVHVGGHIQAISSAAQDKSEWGSGHYYRVDVRLDAAAQQLDLLPGMSARVDTGSDATADTVSVAAAPAAGTLRAAGEVVARRSWNAAAPKIPGLWQLNITQMASDGSQVKKGDALVTFAAGSLATDLPAKQSELAEKQRARDQLRLKLADDERSAELAVVKARADADKARRKAGQPKQYLPGIEYKKLVIDRDSTRRVVALNERRARVAAASRRAQVEEADAGVAQRQRQVERMQASMGRLTIRAPRDGLFLHHVSFDGSKTDVGDQVFFGLGVGNMPDMDTLAIKAELPERDLPYVRQGQAVRVVLSGGSSRTLDGHIAAIGRNVHSKSGSEPVPVIDLDIALDKSGVSLRPGRSVRVDIPPTPETPT